MIVTLDYDEVRAALAKAMWEKICSLGNAPTEEQINDDGCFEIIDDKGNNVIYETVAYYAQF